MKPGNRIILIIIFFFSLFSSSMAEEKITSSPLLNVEKIIPSFEEEEGDNESTSLDQNLKEKKALLQFDRRKQF